MLLHLLFESNLINLNIHSKYLNSLQVKKLLGCSTNAHNIMTQEGGLE